MKLYLVQHAEAISKEENPQRPLSEKGISDAKKMAEFLRQAGVEIKTIFQSEKSRAQQTAQIFGKILNPNCNLITKNNLLPTDPVDAILKEILEREEDLMIISHLPFLARLAARILTGNEEKNIIKFKQGGVLCLEKTDIWQINWFVIPSLPGR